MKTNLKYGLRHALAVGSLLTLSASAQTLPESLEQMLQREPELLAAGYDSVAANHDISIAKSEGRPQISMNGSTGLSERDRSLDGVENGAREALVSRQIGVSLRQQLLDFGATKGRIHSAKHNAKVQEYLENSMIEGRAVDLAEVYLEVLRTREQITASSENVQTHETIAGRLRERVANGQSEADLALVEGRLGLAKTSYDTQQLSLELAENRYARLTGERPGALSSPPRPPIPSKLSDVDLSGNWDYLAAYEAVEAAGFHVKSSKRDRLPKVHFDAGYTAGEDVLGIEGRDNEARALLSLSWNILNGGANKAIVSRAGALERKSERLLEAAEMQRTFSLSNIWMEMKGSESSLGSLRAYSNKLDKVASDYEEQFDLGKRELLAILDVQSEQYSAKSRLIDTEYNRFTSAYRIKGIQGQLVEWLQEMNPNAGKPLPVKSALEHEVAKISQPQEEAEESMVVDASIEEESAPTLEKEHSRKGIASWLLGNKKSSESSETENSDAPANLLPVSGLEKEKPSRFGLRLLRRGKSGK